MYNRFRGERRTNSRRCGINTEALACYVLTNSSKKHINSLLHSPFLTVVNFGQDITNTVFNQPERTKRLAMLATACAVHGYEKKLSITPWLPFLLPRAVFACTRLRPRSVDSIRPRSLRANLYSLFFSPQAPGSPRKVRRLRDNASSKTSLEAAATPPHFWPFRGGPSAYSLAEKTSSITLTRRRFYKGKAEKEK